MDLDCQKNLLFFILVLIQLIVKYPQNILFHILQDLGKWIYKMVLLLIITFNKISKMYSTTNHKIKVMHF